MLTSLPDNEGPRGLERVLPTHTHTHTRLQTGRWRSSSQCGAGFLRASRWLLSPKAHVSRVVSCVCTHVCPHAYAHVCRLLLTRQPSAAALPHAHPRHVCSYCSSRTLLPVRRRSVLTCPSTIPSRARNSATACSCNQCVRATVHVRECVRAAVYSCVSACVRATVWVCSSACVRQHMRVTVRAAVACRFDFRIRAPLQANNRITTDRALFVLLTCTRSCRRRWAHVCA